MTLRADSCTYHFDAFRLDPARGALLGPEGVELRLRPKAFALLRHLLDHPGRLLGREELLDALWPGVAVTDDSLTQCISDLRQVFNDRAPHVLRTVPKRGYMLTAEVRREGPTRSDGPPDVHMAPASTSAPMRTAVALREDPVVIHRLEAPDGERACLVFAETLASDLVAVATRIEGIRVLPASDTGTATGYRVTGEVRATGADLRITLRLEDAASGTALWAERLNQHRGGPSELPEAALLTLAAQLNRHVARHSLSMARRKPVEVLSARELCLIGRDHHGRVTEADTAMAKEMFARAIAADPDYGQAYAWQAYTVQRAITHGWGNPKGQAARDESLRLARRAVQLQPESTLCLARLAFALVLDQRWEDAVDTAHAALSSSRPAFGYTRITCCEVLTAAGYPEEAARIARETIALEPLYPPTAQGILGRALLLAGQAEEALAPLRWCASHLPDFAATYDTLIVASMETGRLPNALVAWKELLRLKPGWEPRNHTGFWYFRRAEDLDRFQSAHRRVAELAGTLDGRSTGPAADASATARASLPAPSVIPAGAMDLALLHRETLVVRALEGAPEDGASARAATAITAGLRSELVRHEDLRVVAGPESRATQGFAVNGTVHASGEGLCAAVRLDDLATGTAVWAGRIEWPSRQATGFSGEGIATLAASVDSQVARESLRRARQKPDGLLSAREVTLLGKQQYDRSTEAETASARQMFARACAMDPGYAAAHAWYAFAVARVAIHGWKGPGRHEVAEQALRLARCAVDLEPESPLCRASLAIPLALADHWEEAVSSARLALRSSRAAGNGARVAACTVLVAAGHPAEAAEALRHAIAQDPHCSPLVHLVLGRALLLMGHPEDAMRELRLCRARLPDYDLGHRTLVVAAVEAGLVEEACEALRNLGRLRPEWMQGTRPMFWFLRKQEDRERYQGAFDMAARLDAAAKAGGLVENAASRA